MKGANRFRHSSRIGAARNGANRDNSYGDEEIEICAAPDHHCYCEEHLTVCPNFDHCLSEERDPEGEVARIRLLRTKRGTRINEDATAN